MKILEITKAVSAPGKDCYGTATIDVELSRMDKIIVQDSKLKVPKEEGGTWEKENIQNITVAEIQGPCFARISGEVRESGKGDVYFSARHMKIDWDSAVMLGHEALDAINAMDNPRNRGPRMSSTRAAAPVGASKAAVDDDVPL